MSGGRAIRAVVFDWAGTTVDFGCRAPLMAFVEGFRQRGVEVTEAEARAPMGLAKRPHIEAMCANPSVAARWRAAHGRDVTAADIDEMYAAFVPALLELLPRFADPIEGVVAVVARLRAAGVRVGSTTGYPREVLEPLVALAAKAGYQPEVAVSADDVSVGRPAPWMLLRACERLGAYPPSRVVKVDDTATGLEAARNAGAWAVGVLASGNEVGLSAADFAALSSEAREARLSTAREALRAAHYTIETVADLERALIAIEARINRGEQP